jgi:DNA-binding MarR family transcriptional regulator
MFDLLMQSAPQRTQSLSRRGLTPNDSRALHTLDVGAGLPMRSLAEAWACDPSNATWIVDRLEALGLAERQPSAVDRRVKLVRLTARGLRTKAELREEFYTAPDALAALDRADLAALERILRKVLRS